MTLATLPSQGRWNLTEKKVVSCWEQTTGFEGRTISGSHAVDGGIIRVRFGGNIMTTHMQNRRPLWW